MANKKVTLYLDDGLVKKLEADKSINKITMSETVVKALNAYYTRNIMAKANEIQTPLVEAVSQLQEDVNYLKQAVNGCYRNVDYLSNLINAGFIQLQNPQTGAIVIQSPAETKRVSRKKMLKDFDKLRLGDADIEAHLVEYEDSYYEDEEQINTPAKTPVSAQSESPKQTEEVSSSKDDPESFANWAFGINLDKYTNKE